MKKLSEQDNQRERLRNSIIGLGERSVRKSYYPELQKRIAELEKVNRELLQEIAERQLAQASQKKLEKQLQQARKMEAIGTLAGGIAHDFNNILTSIIGYTELILCSYERVDNTKRPDLLKDLEQIHKAGMRAKDLVNQILAFSRQQEYQAIPLEIHIVIREAIKFLKASIPKSVEIRADIVNHDTLVLADATQIHQVVMNLCTNAYHAMRDTGGILAIELVHKEIHPDDEQIGDPHLTAGPYLLLKISDTGTGMPKEVLERIFDPYFTTKEKGEGTGMGLAVVHGIVKNHGGSISVYSEVGKGTSFYIYLPKIEQEETKQEVMLTQQVPTGNEHILIIDDEPAINIVEKRLIEGLGYQVTSITNPLDALTLISTHPEMWDLVLTDMTMPKMNGAELAQKILEIRDDMPIILCTGFSELINEKKAKAIGVKEYVMKPLIRKEIAHAIRRSLDS
jgi:signal transduction histidine kinase/ActR/RegA family two-component response regulator